jgi:formamidopyrimidine-DNA glycosylase
MPELPDVEVFKRYFNDTALHKKIEKVDVVDDAILENISSHSFQMRLKNETFKSTSRYGKYLFVALVRDEILVMHFGMTGFLKYYKNDEKSPEYEKMIFNLNNGFKLAYVCTRKFGFIGLVDNQQDFIKKHELGPDAYSDNLDWDTFKEILEGRRGSIKTTLMNQKIIAGIGNVYSDEILFQAKIYPFSTIDTLTEKELKEIYKKMNWVFKKAIEANVEADKFPEKFLLTNRDVGAKCPICGGTIKSEKYSGRTAYYCGDHQQKNN